MGRSRKPQAAVFICPFASPTASFPALSSERINAPIPTYAVPSPIVRWQFRWQLYLGSLTNGRCRNGCTGNRTVGSNQDYPRPDAQAGTIILHHHRDIHRRSNMTPRRRPLSLICATALLCGFALLYWEFSGDGRVSGKIALIPIFMIIVGGIWLLSDFAQSTDASHRGG